MKPPANTNLDLDDYMYEGSFTDEEVVRRLAEMEDKQELKTSHTVSLEDQNLHLRRQLDAVTLELHQAQLKILNLEAAFAGTANTNKTIGQLKMTCQHLKDDCWKKDDH